MTEQAPLLETASTTLGGVVSKEQVADLPINGRSVTDLLALIPGVQLRGNAAQISVGGAGTFTGEGGLHVLLDGGDASRVDFDDVGNTYGPVPAVSHAQASMPWRSSACTRMPTRRSTGRPRAA